MLFISADYGLFQLQLLLCYFYYSNVLISLSCAQVAFVLWCHLVLKCCSNSSFFPRGELVKRVRTLYCLGLLHYCTSILISHAPSLLQKLQWQVPRLYFLLYVSILQHINYSPWENLSTVLELIHLWCWRGGLCCDTEQDTYSFTSLSTWRVTCS